MGGWIKKMWSLHTMNYYSALKQKESLPFATTQKNLEDVILNEISQSQKDKCNLAPPFVKFAIVKFIEVEQWLSGDKRIRTRKVLVKGYRVPVT